MRTFRRATRTPARRSLHDPLAQTLSSDLRARSGSGRAVLLQELADNHHQSVDGLHESHRRRWRRRAADCPAKRPMFRHDRSVGRIAPAAARPRSPGWRRTSVRPAGRQAEERGVLSADLRHDIAFPRLVLPGAGLTAVAAGPPTSCAMLGTGDAAHARRTATQPPPHTAGAAVGRSARASCRTRQPQQCRQYHTLPAQRPPRRCRSPPSTIQNRARPHRRARWPPRCSPRRSPGGVPAQPLGDLAGRIDDEARLAAAADGVHATSPGAARPDAGGTEGGRPPRAPRPRCTASSGGPPAASGRVARRRSRRRIAAGSSRRRR